MLSALSTDEAVGYYSYAQRTVNIVLTMCSAVTAIFLPRLSYYYDNEKAVFYKLMDKGFQILCLGVVPLAVGLFLTANQAVVLLYGDSFTPTGTTIKLMCPLILIKGFGDLLCYQLAYSSKNEYQYTQQPFIHPPHHTHPEERIWAGRTPRVPDAPRIKHDKMKQFYMVDMRRKRW